jgi:NAD dependent epimerase/dehydratase family enzyme
MVYVRFGLVLADSNCCVMLCNMLTMCSFGVAHIIKDGDWTDWVHVAVHVAHVTKCVLAAHFKWMMVHKIIEAGRPCSAALPGSAARHFASLVSSELK